MDSSSLTISQVGSDFVKKYYELLQKQPESVQHLHAASSTMIRVDGESTQTASSKSQIHTLVQSLRYNEIDIKTINSAESLGDGNHGIVVVVSGSVKSDRFSGWRKFVETFCLAPKKTVYFVISDIFHFVSEEDFSGILYAKRPIEIHLIKRKDSETVEDFLFRFMKETSQISGADELKISGFVHGVRNYQLEKQLYANSPQTIVDMIERVKGFVRANNGWAIKKGADRQKSEPSSHSSKRKQNGFSLKVPSSSDSSQSTFSPYHPTRGADSVESWMKQSITFPAIPRNKSQDGPLVISATIAGYHIRQIKIDIGSASEIMFESCFLQLDEDIRKNLTKDPNPFVTLRGEELRSIGQIRLPVIIGVGDRFRTLDMTFSVVRARFSPNIIIGRSGMGALRAVSSTIHGAIKFPTPRGVVTLYSGESHHDCQMPMTVMPNAEWDNNSLA